MTLPTNSVLNIVAGGGDGLNGLTLTNYGTVNWTNTQLYGINDTNAQIYNYGLWNAQSDNSFAGGFNGGTTLFDNFGTFLKSGNTGSSTLDANVVFNNPGTVSVQNGTLGIQGSYSLANGTLNFGINSLTSYGAVSFPGSAALTGTLSANFNNGYMPATGSQFQVVSSIGRSGTFSSVNVPAGVSALYFNNSVVLDVTGLVPVEIINTHLAGSNLLFQFNTVSGQSYTIQWNDDLATNNWAFYTNFIGSGAVFQFQTPVMASPPQKFFRVLQP
jgi:hypothetical protein